MSFSAGNGIPISVKGCFAKLERLYAGQSGLAVTFAASGCSFFGHTVVLDTESSHLVMLLFLVPGESGLCVRMVVMVQTMWSACVVVGADHNID